MTLDLLKLLHHEISKTNWLQDSKQVVWGAFTMAFFGCFRMGELLPQNENSFNKENTSPLERFKIQRTIPHFSPHQNSRLPHGEYVDIFSFTGHSVCPVRAMTVLREQRGTPDPESQVFRFSTGTCLTRRLVNSVLPELLKPHIGSESTKISGHSFRAGIPAVLASNLEVASSSDIMGWGRWKSEAYHSYTTLKLGQKKTAFSKITNLLNK